MIVTEKIRMSNSTDYIIYIDYGASHWDKASAFYTVSAKNAFDALCNAMRFEDLGTAPKSNRLIPQPRVGETIAPGAPICFCIPKSNKK